MTTTAYDDQFSAEPEPVHQPYDVAEILRRNITDLESELKRQKERAEKAEAELKELREQKPVAWINLNKWTPSNGPRCVTHEEYEKERELLTKLTAVYAAPIPAPAVPAPEIPDGDDFNGTTPHLIQCIEALVRMSDCGVLVPHGIGSHARTLLLASANRLRQQPALAVPDEWREVMAELAADLQACIEAEHAYRDQYSFVMRKYQNDMRIVERARALLQSAGGGK